MGLAVLIPLTVCLNARELPKLFPPVQNYLLRVLLILMTQESILMLKTIKEDGDRCIKKDHIYFSQNVTGLIK